MHNFPIGKACRADVGGQRFPDSVRIYCVVSVSYNLKFSVGRVFECPVFEFELDFERKTPHSTTGQNPDSAVRRRLLSGTFPQISDGRESLMKKQIRLSIKIRQNDQKIFQNFEFQATYVCNRRRKHEIEKGLE